MLVGAPERQAHGDGGAILQAHDADDSPRFGLVEASVLSEQLLRFLLIFTRC